MLLFKPTVASYVAIHDSTHIAVLTPGRTRGRYSVTPTGRPLNSDERDGISAFFYIKAHPKVGLRG